ncbi:MULTISPECIES: type I polyketide synthase [Nostocales]|uniref:Type I polyketide synthase n=3 Tax=Nostocales TaxID=1161 RepID=A0A8S9SZT8_9CYAN|nr:type I polyketide synthase [Tolypothrix bouteillei]KAF3885901.1 type I polyketide synthase [Tolypothrix bouteillei VB521301]
MNNPSEDSNHLSPLQRAVFAIKEMRSQLDTLERSRTEPIAIIGIGCQFPGNANEPEPFWQLLRNGVDATREIPTNRWNIDAYYDPNPKTPGKSYTRRGGFLDKVDEFDAEFFAISPREAVSMDPQQRLLLEVSYSALENAGIASDKLIGSQSGVFIGISARDYEQLSSFTDIDVYSATGNALSIAAGRLSYFLGLSGPALSVDTACSSSLVAVHLACQSLRNGECHLALAGGVQLILSPQTNISMSMMQALSPDGRCKTFDASADGYGRGEGCGIVVLKRLSDAIADRDNILALIRGSAVNQDGRSSGLTVPNGLAQNSLIRSALDNAKVEPSQVSYVETHGTGTSLGDPIEVKALGAVLGQRQPEEQPLMIGSVKTNIGHLEAAAGVAGLIKVVLAMQHQEIPPHLHLNQLNPLISLEKTSLKIPTKLTPWTSQEQQRRIAGVSSFGFSGTNAHVILEEAPQASQKKEGIERPVHILTLSAKTEAALKKLASRYELYFAGERDFCLGDICFTANTGRAHFAYRMAIVTTSLEQIRQQLAAFACGQHLQGLSTSQTALTKKAKVAFLFAGQGSHYIDMGRQLYETQPVFRHALKYCDQLLRPYLEQPLLSVLYPPPGVTSLLDRTTYTQAALFALEYSLAQLWLSWGIQPDAVMGHGVGKYVAGCVAGVFSVEDGLKLITHAFHTPLKEPILDSFAQIAAEVVYSSPKIDLASNVTGQFLKAEDVTRSQYWCRPIDEPANLKASLQMLHEQGYNVFVEIGPHSTFIEIGTPCLPEKAALWLPSLMKGQEDWQVLLQSLGSLYTEGIDVNWVNFDKDYNWRRLSLPTYPFERQRFWKNASEQKYQEVIIGSSKIAHPLLGRQLRSPLKQVQFESQFSIDLLPLVKDHGLQGVPVVNLVIYLEMVLAAAAEAFGQRTYILEDVFIPQALVFSKKDICTVQLILCPDEVSGKISFQIFSLISDEANKRTDWTMHSTGVLRFEQQDSTVLTQKPFSFTDIEAQSQKPFSGSQFYEMMAERGMNLGLSCQSLEQIWLQEGEVIGKVVTGLSEEANSQYYLPLDAIDACFQLLSASFAPETSDTYVIVGFESFQFYGYASTRTFWAKARLHSGKKNCARNEIIAGDVSLFDLAGQLVAEVINVQLKCLDRVALQPSFQAGRNELGIQFIETNHKEKDNFSTDKLLAMEPAERQRVLETYVIGELASSLQIPVTKLNSDMYLASMLDSLMAFEVRSRIESRLGVRVPMEKFFGDNTVTQLVQLLLNQLTLTNLVLSDATFDMNTEREKLSF